MTRFGLLALLTVLVAGPAAGQPAAAEAERSLDAGRFLEAASKFRALTAAEPASPTAWYGLGRSYEALAREAFARLQAVASGSPWEALIVAEVWTAAERFPQALELYREVEQAAPAISGLHEAIADLYERAGQPEWAARERARAPAQPAACKPAAADCEFLAGRFQEAVDATGGRQDAQSLYWRTRAYNALATAAFATLDSLPASAEVHRVRAAVDRDQGRTLDAIPELKAALALSPGNADIERDLAEALYETKNLDEALPLLKRLAGPADRAPADFAFFYGDALLQGQQVTEALPYLQAAFRQRPDVPQVRASLGRALLQSGDAAAALPHLQAAAKGDDPDSDGAAHYQLALAYQRLGRPVEAKTALAEYRRRQEAAQQAAGPPAAPGEGLTPPQP